MVNLNSYNAILTNLDRQKKRSFGATGDSQSSSQGSVAKSLRRDRNLERPTCPINEGFDEQLQFHRLTVENDTRPLNSLANHVKSSSYNDPLLQDRAFVTDPFDELESIISPPRRPSQRVVKPSQLTCGDEYDQEIEDIITQMDEAASADLKGDPMIPTAPISAGPTLSLRVEFNSKNFFWKGALLVFWGYGSCAEHCQVTTASCFPQTEIHNFLHNYVHQQGGSSLTAICACAFRKILDLPIHQSYATLPACIIHILPTFLGVNSLKSVYNQHKTREMNVAYTQPPPDFIPELGNVVHRTSPFLQLKHPSGELPGPAPYQRIATHLWIKYCVMDSHHYPESSFAFFKPGKDGTRKLLHVNGRRLRVSVIGTLTDNSRPRKHRSRELWVDVIQDCFDLQVVEFPEYISPTDITPSSVAIQTSHGSERLNLFEEEVTIPEIIICLNGVGDVSQLTAPPGALKRLIELDVPFVVVSWLLKSYDNGIFWSLAEYTLNNAVKRQVLDKMNSWDSPIRLEETINDDLGTGYWDDDVVMKKLPDDLKSNIQDSAVTSTNPEPLSQAGEERVALCVSAGTWERYPAFPGTALTTLKVANFGLCLNMAQLLYHQLCAVAHSNLSSLVSTESILEDMPNLIENQIKISARLQNPIFECLLMDRVSSNSAGDIGTPPNIIIDHLNFVWRTKSQPNSDKTNLVSLTGRLVLLPPEIDVWQNLTRSLDIEKHCIWKVIKNVILGRVVPNLVSMSGRERFRVLRLWYIHTRDLSVGYEPEPLYLVSKTTSSAIKVVINNYCSTQKLRNRQDECCREVTEALTAGEGVLWQEESTLKPVSKLIELIVETIIDAIREAEFTDQLNDIENDLLTTIRQELGSEDLQREAASCAYGSQLGLRPIDLELTEEIHTVFDDETNDQRLNQELTLNTALLAKYKRGSLSLAPR